MPGPRVEYQIRDAETLIPLEVSELTLSKGFRVDWVRAAKRLAKTQQRTVILFSRFCTESEVKDWVQDEVFKG